MKADRDIVLKYAEENYGSHPEYLWESTPDSGVLRHKTNKKWYAVMLSVKRSTLGLDGYGKIDILNVKCQPQFVGSLIQKKGYLPAYHMNKQHWVTILLDGSVEAEEVFMLIDESYELTAPKIKR